MERAQALGDGILDAAFSMVLEGRRTDAEQSEYWLSRWRDAISRALAAMSRDIETAGSDFDLGHITYVCALDYLDFVIRIILGGRSIQNSQPGMTMFQKDKAASQHSRVKSRPGFLGPK